MPDSESTATLAGRLRLRAACREDGTTTLAEQSFKAPFHIGKSYREGNSLRVQIVNPTAGILAGDRLELDVRVDRDAALCLTTPAATRVFRMNHGEGVCIQHFTTAAGSALEFWPEPLCPHAGTRFSQRSCIDADPDSDVYWVDALAPGRVARGEAFAWDRLEVVLDVRIAGEPVLRERLACAGSELARSAAFHRTPTSWFATVVVLSPRCDAHAPLQEEIRALHSEGTSAGVTRLRRGGWVVRLLAPDGQALRDGLERVRAVTARDLPLLRHDLRRV
jgi:urease accessory protein